MHGSRILYFDKLFNYLYFGLFARLTKPCVYSISGKNYITKIMFSVFGIKLPGEKNPYTMYIRLKGFNRLTSLCFILYI